MSDSKPNARRPATPRPAVEAALADDAGAPLRRALWLDALDQQLRPLLPPGLAPHCRLANVNGGQLVFLTDSPVWRARLRLAEAELLGAARSIGLEPTAVVVKTTTSPLRPHQATTTTTSTVSATARQAVADALASLREPRPGDRPTPEPGAPGDSDPDNPSGPGRPPQVARGES
ncbi:DciA family protein [Pseudoxanthomonas koreensis]|uniref:DciA family protein n=1 Tax=Pseudoxanthomonas koreensis TaxID=266061 RepID=UPI0035A5F225